MKTVKTQALPASEHTRHTMTTNLKDKIIRLAYQNPELRADLLPLVVVGSSLPRKPRRGLPWASLLAGPDNEWAAEHAARLLSEMEEIIGRDLKSILRMGSGHFKRKEMLPLMGYSNELYESDKKKEVPPRLYKEAEKAMKRYQQLASQIGAIADDEDTDDEEEDQAREKLNKLQRYLGALGKRTQKLMRQVMAWRFNR